MKKHLNLNTVLLLLLGGMGAFVKYDVDKIRKATDEVPIISERMSNFERRLESLENEKMLLDQRIRIIEDKRGHP